MSVVARLSVVIGANITGLTAGINEANNKVGNFKSGFENKLDSLGGSMTRLGTNLSLALAPLTGFGLAGINTAMDFESALAEIQVRAGLTSDELDMVSNKAKQLGADTVFSAQDAANAFLELLASGQNIDEAMVTIDSVMVAAAASGEGLGKTADTLTDIMAAFNIQLTTVPTNFAALRSEIGVTDQMFTDFGNGIDVLETDPIYQLAEALDVSVGEVYEIWNASKVLTPEIQTLADTLEISSDQWKEYNRWLMSGGEQGGVSDGIRELIDATGLSGTRITEMMTGYNQAAMVTESLALAAGASSADIASLGQGFANVGGIAHLFGLSVDETAAILAIFSENGIKGAEAGTQLKSMLLNMARDTDKVQGAWAKLGVSMYDSAGNMRDLDTVMTELGVKFDNMPLQEQHQYMQTLAGSYGILGQNALLNSMSIDEMKDRMYEQASATDVATAKNETLEGKVNALKGSIETAMIEVFTPFNDDVLKPMVKNITEIVNKFTDWAEENPELTQQIILLVGGAAALSAALLIGGTIVSGFAAAITGLRVAALFLSGPIGLLVLAVGGLIALISDTGVQQGLAAWGEAFNTLGVIIGRLSDRVGRWFNNMVRDVQIAVLEMVGGLRDAIYEMSGGTIDIAPNVNAQIADIKALKLTSTFVDSFTQLLGHHLGSEDMDLSGMSFGVDFGDGNMSTVLMSSVLPSDSAMVKQWANDMGFEARNALTESLAKLAGEGDITGLKMLAPLALELGIATPSDEMRTAVSEKLGDILASGNMDDFAYFLQLAVQADIGMDTPKLAGMFRQMVMGTLEEDPNFDVSIYAMVAAMLGVDMDDIEGQVTGAIEGGNYDTSVNVNVNPIIKLIGDVVGAITSQIPSTVTKAVNVAASVGGSILGAMGVPFFDVGTPKITREGLGYLHEGEAVLTKAQADAWRAGVKGRPQAVAVGGSTTVNHYHINSYGQSPAQLARLLDKELKLSGR
jgi:TP901 family phage tail tape measure protein